MRLARSAAAVLAFAALIALGARLAVPMVPVPMTMQTFAVLLAGAVLGPWRGAAAVLLYLAAAAAGLPVLSDGASGLAPFAGPTAGYLFAFPVAALLVGLSARRGRFDQPLEGFITLYSVHIFILSLGAVWLAREIGLSRAMEVGWAPFLVGAVVKSALVLLAERPLRGLKP